MLSKQMEYIRSQTDFQPEIAVVLGSGLGAFAEKAEIIAVINYCDIPDFPVSTAPGHNGRFVFCRIADKNVVMMQGRIHLYEGYTPQKAVMPIRLMRALGAKVLLLTNAAGGINKRLNIGDFMLISDHISCFVPSPLIGKNDEKIGTRFPDMSNAYDKALRKTAKTIAKNHQIKLREGVYAQLTGPQFESPAEIKMLSLLGADAVGMSTVIETIAAVHCGFRVCAISLISNLACGVLDKPLSGEEVCDTANANAAAFETLMKEIIKAI